MEALLRTLLLNDPSVATTLGDRIFWGRAPQGATLDPNYAVLQIIGSTTDYHMQGPSGYRMSRVQIDSYSVDYLLAKTSAKDIIAKLSGYKDDTFQGIFVDTERDLPVTDPGKVTDLFRVSVDFMVHYRSE